MIRAEVDERGPLFNGQAAAAVGAYTGVVEREIADAGVDLVHEVTDVSFRNPTGYFDSQVHAELSGDGWLVTDGGVVYGPWLEGVGSRNDTSRFKGYFMFRLAAQRLNDHDALPIAEQVLTPFLGRMQ